MVEKEERVLHRLLLCVVVGKLRMNKKLIPISHGCRHKTPQHILGSGIHALSLISSLRVECSGHIPAYFEPISQSLVVFASILRASVRNDFQWKAMIAKNMLHDQVSPSLCVALGCSTNSRTWSICQYNPALA